ncbi:hypothetical protein [Micromonospora arborensis]|uniref:hypothetical protein n=1 Tax=Micromonospora arborensis TaxID=2116518 RepID=UPI0037183B86
MGVVNWPNSRGQSCQPRSRCHCLVQVSSAGQREATVTAQTMLPSHGLRAQVAEMIRRCQRTKPGDSPLANRQAVAANVTGAKSPQVSANSSIRASTSASYRPRPSVPCSRSNCSSNQKARGSGILNPVSRDGVHPAPRTYANVRALASSPPTPDDGLRRRIVT